MSQTTPGDVVVLRLQFLHDSVFRVHVAKTKKNPLYANYLHQSYKFEYQFGPPCTLNAVPPIIRLFSMCEYHAMTYYWTNEYVVNVVYSNTKDTYHIQWPFEGWVCDTDSYTSTCDS